MSSKEVLKYGDNLFLFHQLLKVGINPDLILEILHEKQEKLTLGMWISEYEEYDLKELNKVRRFVNYAVVILTDEVEIEDLKKWFKRNNIKLKILNTLPLEESEYLNLLALNSPNEYIYCYQIGKKIPTYIDLPVDTNITKMTIIEENKKKRVVCVDTIFGNCSSFRQVYWFKPTVEVENIIVYERYLLD